MLERKGNCVRSSYMQMPAGHDPAIGPFVRSRDEGEPIVS